MTLWIVFAVACALSVVAAALSARLTAAVPILGTWVRLEHVENPGIAFSIALPRTVLPVVLGIAFVAILSLAVRAKSQLERVAYGAILGGALANIIDRLPDGFVTDVFAVRGFSVFNLADAFITLGALALAWNWYRGRMD